MLYCVLVLKDTGHPRYFWPTGKRKVTVLQKAMSCCPVDVYQYFTGTAASVMSAECDRSGRVLSSVGRHLPDHAASQPGRL
jgi:hypothetical protein